MLWFCRSNRGIKHAPVASQPASPASAPRVLEEERTGVLAGTGVSAHPLTPVPVMTMFIPPSAHLGKHSRRGKIVCQLYDWSGSKYAASISLAAYRGWEIIYIILLIEFGCWGWVSSSFMRLPHFAWCVGDLKINFLYSFLQHTGSYFQLIGAESSYLLLEQTGNATGDSSFGNCYFSFAQHLCQNRV